MSPCNKTAAIQDFSTPGERKFDMILGRIDLLAAMIAVLGALLMSVVAAVMAVLGLARLISALWADASGRWVIVVLALAVVWVCFRGRKLCVF